MSASTPSTLETPRTASWFFVNATSELVSNDEKEVAGQFGQKVRTHREGKGWTQGDLASELGKSQQWLGKVEAGDLTVSLKDSIAIAEALGIPIRRLLPPEPAPTWFEPDERTLLANEIQSAEMAIAKLEPQVRVATNSLAAERARLEKARQELAKLNKKRSSS